MLLRRNVLRRNHLMHLHHIWMDRRTRVAWKVGVRSHSLDSGILEDTRLHLGLVVLERVDIGWGLISSIFYLGVYGDIPNFISALCGGRDEGRSNWSRACCWRSISHVAHGWHCNIFSKGRIADILILSSGFTFKYWIFVCKSVNERGWQRLWLPDFILR